MSAVLSDDGVYRYALWRQWQSPLDFGGLGTVLFVMLNPSTADAKVDDPTIRRCIRFAAREGFDRLAVGNLFALRATHPVQLLLEPDPVGPCNDRWLCDLAADADCVVAAWGAIVSDGRMYKRARQVVAMLGRPLKCLGVTRAGQPRHPLYLAANTPLEDFG